MWKGKRNGTNRTNTTYVKPAPGNRPPKGFIPPHGGYEHLLSYKKAVIVFDATVRFCERFIDPKSRTYDQMVQAARSGNKNIAEGSQISGTSKEGELKLVGVARGSLEELLGDYRDYLRPRGHVEWDKNSKEALFLRKLGRRAEPSYESYREFIETRPGVTVAKIYQPHSSGQLLVGSADSATGKGFS